MAKEYTKERIKELLQEKYDAESVIQIKEDYEDEYHILIRKPDGVFEDKHVEVVSQLTALKNSEDLENNKHKYLWNVIEAFCNGEELLAVGDYSKLAENLFWREY